MEDFVSLNSPYDNWTLEKRRAGKKLEYSEKHKTYLCNYLYLVYNKHGKMNWTCLENGIKPKIYCCECSSKISNLTATWYQYYRNNCENCGRQISTIYGK